MRFSTSNCISKNERGATLTEFAVVAFFMFVFLVSGFEVLRLSYTKLCLQFLASRALREAVVGPEPTPQTGAAHAAEIETFIVNLAGGLAISLDRNEIFVCAGQNMATCLDSTTGETTSGPQQMLTVRIVRSIDLLFVGDYQLLGQAVGRTEPAFDRWT